MIKRYSLCLTYRNLSLVILLFLFSCKKSVNPTSQSDNKKTTINVNSKKEITQLNDTNLNTDNYKYFNKIELNCNSKEFPSLCNTKGFEVKFLFKEEPNKLLINNENALSSYELEYFFERLNYIPYLFQKGEKRFLVVELLYEYGSKLLVFQVNKKSNTFLVGTFSQEDLTDENNNYIENDIFIAELNNKFILKIGNEKVFKSFTLDLSKRKEIDNKKRILYFDIDSLLINNKIPLYGSIDKLGVITNNQFHNTSENIECGGFFDDEASINYYKNSYIEVTKKQYAFTRVNLNDSLFLTYNNRFTLDKNLSIKNFLKEVQHSTIYENEYFDEFKKKGTVINVRVCEQCDSFWRFLFLNNKLLVVHFFIPC